MTLFKPGEIEIDYTVPSNTDGAFCDLLCGTHPELGKVALKRLRWDMSGSSRLPVRPIPCGTQNIRLTTLPPQTFLGEVRVWQSLSHPHLLPLLGVLFDEHVSLVSPFVENGSLPAYLIKNPNADRTRFVSSECGASC